MATKQSNGPVKWLMIISAIILIAAMWKVFTKAGKPGWAAIIPIYNIWVLLEIAGKPVRSYGMLKRRNASITFSRRSPD